MNQTLQNPAPARLVLQEGEKTHEAFGHPDDGPLSEAFGLLPATPPLEQMPNSYRDWDRLAARIPELFHARILRDAIDDLPEIPVDEERLPDAYLCRAACLLGLFAHGYARGGEGPIEKLPERLLRPWTNVCRRLGRPGPGLTFGDLVTYNWKLRDPDGERRLDNLDLLVPIAGNEDERIFYMASVEMTARASRVFRAMVRVQEAILRDDPAAVGEELSEIAAGLDQTAYRAFLKIDPNPYAETNIDPVVWARTVAPFAGPPCPGHPGVSGASAGLFHVLDAFFGRPSYDSEMGRLMNATHPWDPRRHREFMDALTQVPVRDYVLKRADLGDRESCGLFQAALEAYAGPRGLLGLHRLKLYGFMELGFRAGRSVTAGEFSGTVAQRAWEILDDEIEHARRERYDALSIRSASARRISVRPAAQKGPVRRVELDLADSGIRFQPGERIAISAAASPDLARRTLDALRAESDASLELTVAWQKHLRRLLGREIETRVSLKLFLIHAQIRPMPRSTAKDLHEIVRLPVWKRILESRTESHWELWDFLRLLDKSPYDPRRLWKSPAWSRENLSRLVPPAAERIYSVSSAQTRGRSTKIDLTIGALQYVDEKSAEFPENRPRRGSVSDFLTRDDPDTLAEAFPIRRVRPSRFHLPDDDSLPLVLFAGGSGISPFRGFLQARAACENPGEIDLYVGTQTPETLCYRDELEDAATSGRLRLRVSFSRSDRRLRGDRGGLIYEDAPAGYVDRWMDDEDEALRLYELLRARSDGGRGGVFYVCGQSRFAATVVEGLRRILRRFSPEDENPDEAFYRLTAQRRLMLDVFTTFAPSTAPGVLGDETYDASEITRRNRPDACWTILRGRVYDLTDFLHLHPGGAKILLLSGGIDATRSYEKVEHHLHPEVHAMIDMYKIGKVRRLDFGETWGVAMSLRPTDEDVSGVEGLKAQMEYLTLQDLYRRWIRFLYALVEIENSLSIDRSALERPFAPWESSKETSGETPFTKLDFLLDSHRRFHEEQLEPLFAEPLDQLWTTTIGLCGPKQRVSRLRDALREIRIEAPIRIPTRATARIPGEYDRSLTARCIEIVREGVRVFEVHEAKTLERGAADLVEVLPRLPEALKRYHQELAAALSAAPEPDRTNGDETS